MWREPLAYISMTGFVFSACVALSVRDFIQDREGRKYWLILASLMTLLVVARFAFLPE
jgi:hypothetical protein